MTTTQINFETATIEELEDYVRVTDAKLAHLPEIARALADDREVALQMFVEALSYEIPGPGMEAARRLGWAPNTVYRVLNGRAGRTSARRKD